MGWEVVFAPRSEIDLAKIVSYIANDDPAAAVRFGETLINKAESLADVPGWGRCCRERRPPDFYLSAAI